MEAKEKSKEDISYDAMNQSQLPRYMEASWK